MIREPYYIVRNSKIHGRGVFAKRQIRKGTRVIEYTGPIVSEKEADRIGIQNENGHSHTMLFEIGKNKVINGNEGGDARYVNHGCDPNCEAIQDGDQVFIEAIRTIRAGEELSYDYHLQVEGKITDEVKKEFACFCGSPKCRGTQIDDALLAKQAKKDALKKKQKEEKARLKMLAKKEKADKKAAALKKKEEAKAAKKAKKDKFKNASNKIKDIAKAGKPSKGKKKSKKKDSKKKDKKKGKKK
jgi:hypothetical protein